MASALAGRQEAGDRLQQGFTELAPEPPARRGGLAV